MDADTIQAHDLLLAVKKEELHGANDGLAATDAVSLLLGHNDLSESDGVHDLVWDYFVGHDGIRWSSTVAPGRILQGWQERANRFGKLITAVD